MKLRLLVGEGIDLALILHGPPPPPTPQGMSDRELRRHLAKSDRESERAAKKAARMELLLQEEPG